MTFVNFIEFTAPFSKPHAITLHSISTWYLFQKSKILCFLLLIKKKVLNTFIHTLEVIEIVLEKLREIYIFVKNTTSSFTGTWRNTKKSKKVCYSIFGLFVWKISKSCINSINVHSIDMLYNITNKYKVNVRRSSIYDFKF